MVVNQITHVINPILQPFLQWVVSKCHDYKENATVIKQNNGLLWAAFAENQK